MNMKRCLVLLLTVLLLLPVAGLAEEEDFVPETDTHLRSGKTVVLQGDPTYEPLPSAPDNCCLTFRFSCEEDPTVYECCIAGITLEESVLYPADADEAAQLLMTVIADHFYADDILTLTSADYFEEEFGLCFRVIDAEKAHLYPAFGRDSTDSDMCWAGSVSDMLTMSGWGAAAGFADEDALFDYFEASFTDDGMKQECGVKWFLNGVSTGQDHEEDGTVANGLTFESMNGSQERWTDLSSKNGGLFTGYASELLCAGYDAEKDGYEPLLAAIPALSGGQSVSLGVTFTTDSGRLDNSHAITVMGYIRDTSSDTVVSLFISDPDNSKEDCDDRSTLPDSLVMYPLREGEPSPFFSGIDAIL